MKLNKFTLMNQLIHVQEFFDEDLLTLVKALMHEYSKSTHARKCHEYS
jgi:hypothetical protein